MTALATVGPPEPGARRATIRPAHGDEIPAVLELWRAETVASATDSEKALRELCALVVQRLGDHRGAELAGELGRGVGAPVVDHQQLGLLAPLPVRRQ